MAISMLVLGVWAASQANGQTEEPGGAGSQTFRRTNEDGGAAVTLLNRAPAERMAVSRRAILRMGNRLTLDDSSWHLVKPRLEAPQDAVVFRRWIEVPASFAGVRPDERAPSGLKFRAMPMAPCPRLSISTGGRDPGRMELGADSTVRQGEKPGDKVLVAVKLLHTVDKKNHSRDRIEIDFAENRPNPEIYGWNTVRGRLQIPGFSKEGCRGHGDAGEVTRRSIWRRWREGSVPKSMLR